MNDRLSRDNTLLPLLHLHIIIPYRPINKKKVYIYIISWEELIRPVYTTI